MIFQLPTPCLLQPSTKACVSSDDQRCLVCPGTRVAAREEVDAEAEAEVEEVEPSPLETRRSRSLLFVPAAAAGCVGRQGAGACVELLMLPPVSDDAALWEVVGRESNEVDRPPLILLLAALEEALSGGRGAVR